MTGEREARPPRLASTLLAICLPGGGVRESVLGDLEELFARRAEQAGRGRATLWYWGQVAALGGAYLWRRARGVRIRGFEPRLSDYETGGEVMRDFTKDVRFALRSLSGAPAFFSVALITLALGVGANTAIFSVINGVYLRPLAFEEPDRLVQIGQAPLDGPATMNTHTAGTWVDWRERQTSFDRFAGYRYWTTTLEHGDVARRVISIHSLGSIFDVLGAEPVLGRTFTDAEEGAGSEGLVVLSHWLWQGELGGEDPIGQTLVIDGVPHTIIGVMPPSFQFPTPAVALWKTADLSAEELLDRSDHFVSSLGRLAPGRSLEQAEAEMARIQADLREEHPVDDADARPVLLPLHEFLVGGVGTLWGTLMGSVALVLLIACANVANLLLSRAASREGEIAVRRALGASRGRLGRQLLVESLVLAAFGGLAGLGVGALFLEGILAWMPGSIPRPESVSIDATVLVFTLGVAGVAGMAAGLLPGLQLTRTSLGERIRRTSRHDSPDRARQGLVVAEIAVAVVLLTGSGLLLRDFAATRAVDPGFRTEDRTSIYLEMPEEGGDGPARHRLYRDLERAVAELPGVRAVGLGSVVPMSGFTPGAWVGAPGVPVPHGDDTPVVRYVAVSPGYREALGIPLLRGRDLTRDDGRGGTPSLLLSESAAARLFPGEDPVGQRIYLGPDGVVAPVSTVVGIVGDVRQSGLSQAAPPIAYAPQESVDFWRGFDLVIESRGDREALGAEVRRLARALQPGVVVLRPQSLDTLLAGAAAGQRNVMLLFGLLAGVALVLAVVGVFGVVAYLAGRRTSEIGVRIAMGAAAGEVEALVLRDSFVPVALGAGLGLVAAVALSRSVARGLLVGVAPSDPLTFALAPALLIAVAMLASWIPARRAARVDPVEVLARR